MATTIVNDWTGPTISGNGTFETTAAPEDPNEAYLKDVASKLTLYIHPVITFGGIIGNVLMFMVMQVCRITK